MRNEEFEAVKAELAREILNMDSEELDRIKERLRNTEADAIAGRGLTEEEADKLFDEMA